MGQCFITRKGGQSKARLFKVGSVTLKYGVTAGNNNTATLDIKSVYPNYAKLTVDDICFPVTYSRGWFEDYPNTGGNAVISSFKKSYSPSTGVITISASTSGSYCNTQINCDVYVLDRFG